MAAPSIILYTFLDEEDEDDETILIAAAMPCRRVHHRTKNFFESTIPRYLPDTFRRFFRMSRPSFEILYDHLASCRELQQRQFPGGRPETSLEKAILMVLRYFASQETIFEISDRFDVTEFTFLKYKSLIIESINRTLLQKFITWPGANEYDEISTHFSDIKVTPFPGIIGAIDGTHIRIDPPKDNPNSYYNRKKFHSIILQGVCKHDLSFININIGWPGRVHDAKVFRNSTIFEIGDIKCHHGHYHILGDCAYPLKRWLITPYRDTGHLTRNEINFNKNLSARRQVIERSFGLLKGRFCRLKYIRMRDVKEICSVISAACVLHNICILSGEELDEFMEADEDMNQDNIQPLHIRENNAEGVLKRINLSNQLAR